MNKEKLVNLIEVAAGRKKADVVIKNAHVVDVYTGKLIDGDIAITDGLIAGVGNYEGETTIDAEGGYAAPGFIDGHMHIESVHVSPEEMGRICVPHGTTTLIADPHEIANVAGNTAMRYMMDASDRTALDIRYMYPSCVPATPFEHAGAVLTADEMRKLIDDDRILGIGEFMNYPGVINCADADIDKILLGKEKGMVIDGHSPNIEGNELNAYVAAGVHDDHECATIKEMEDRISRGMYILMRYGTSCHDLKVLVKGITKENARRLVLCTDDKQANTIVEKGHLEEHLRILRDAGVDPIMALTFASLNAAECFRLHDRGAIAPGLRADIAILKDLENFDVKKVLIEGRLVAEDGKYLLPVEKQDITPVRGSCHVKDFSEERLKLNLKSKKVHTIDLVPGGVLSKKSVAEVDIDEEGNFVYNPEADLVKIAVIERHQNTGNVACGFLRGYGIKAGAIALTIAHDSHNIVVTGTSDSDMAFAVEELIKQEGGIILVKDKEVLHRVPMPIGGLMSDLPTEELVPELKKVDEIAFGTLGISQTYDPVTTLCFMSLPVIPEVKLTDVGLFDVATFSFIPLEAE